MDNNKPTTNPKQFNVVPALYNITLRDSKGNLLEELEADRYVIIAQVENQFTRRFSSNDFVDHLGLLHFALELDRKDIQNVK